MLAGLAGPKVRFRYPTADEQTVLSGMTVRLLERPQEIQRCNQLLTEHHYHQVKRWHHEQRESTTVGSPIRIAAAARPADNRTPVFAASVSEFNCQQNCEQVSVYKEREGVFISRAENRIQKSVCVNFSPFVVFLRRGWLCQTMVQLSDGRAAGLCPPRL